MKELPNELLTKQNTREETKEEEKKVLNGDEMEINM